MIIPFWLNGRTNYKKYLLATSISQGWFTPGNPELSAWRRSFLPSTNVISDTGQVPIPGTCQAHERNFLELNNPLYLFIFFFYWPKKGLQNEEMGTQETACKKQHFFLFFNIPKKGLRIKEMSTQLTKRHLSPFWIPYTYRGT